MNIIPGLCEFVVELRGGTVEEVAELRAMWAEELYRIAERRGIRVVRYPMLDQPAQPLDSLIMSHLERSAADQNIKTMRLTSMAGHDATHVATVTRAGMVFVPSIGGKSHCKEEESRMGDIEHAIDVMLRTATSLDEVLD